MTMLTEQEMKTAVDLESALVAGFRPCKRCHGSDQASSFAGLTGAGGAGESITWACGMTTLGLLAMAITDKGVCFAQFGPDETALISELKSEFPHADLLESASSGTVELDDWIKALDRHISQGAPRPELPIDMRGTAFQMKVWQFLTSTREGDILSYSQVADRIDKPRAVRAVASACARNRIGILIPCHRILRGDGSLGGYRWGLERKKALIELERARVRTG